jgi:hypothetical protein
MIWFFTIGLFYYAIGTGVFFYLVGEFPKLRDDILAVMLWPLVLFILVIGSLTGTLED